MDFFLFLLVNFTLFVRPSELIPDLETVPLYNIFIILALLVALPRLVEHLRPQQLEREPITVCVIGFWVSIILSHLSHLDFYFARVDGIEFSKIVVYYLVMISVVNSSARIRRFLYWIALFTTCNAAVAMAHFYGYINVPSLRILEYAEQFDPETGEPILFKRMQATGIFSDPNDLSMIAVMGMVIALFGLGDRQLGGWRLAWLVPCGILLATIALTKSRGGVLALGAAVAILMYARYGWWKAAVAAALFFPLVSLLTVGRSAGMAGTGDERVMYWSEGLMLMRQAPIFGIGKDQLAEEIGHVAHNSFVQTHVELGVFGGMMFLGAFWFSLLGLWKSRGMLKTMGGLLPDRTLERLLPYLLSIIGGACLSMMSLTRYGVPTFMLLGLVTAYFLEAERQGLPAVVRCSAWRFAGELPLLSVAFLALIKVFIRLKLS